LFKNSKEISVEFTIESIFRRVLYEHKKKAALLGWPLFFKNMSS